jgi:putative ABC transport system substrate-binding protein
MYLALPIAAQAQEAGRIYSVGGLSAGSRTAPYLVAVFEELRRAGFIEGTNLIIDWRTYGSNIDPIPEFVAELVKARVDVIVATGDLAIRTAQRATTTIPILGMSDDMVGSGLVNSLARPGGNTTGTSLLNAELDGKRLEILTEAMPGISRIAALVDSNTTTPRRLQELQDDTRGRGVELSIHKIARPQEIPAAIDAAKASGAEGLNVLSSPLLVGNRAVIIQRVAALRLPTIYQYPEEAEEGGFIGYGSRLVPTYRELLGPQLVKLLRGAKPADLPIEQPTKFELAVNLKTAKALGLTIPESFLARADKVIEQ